MTLDDIKARTIEDGDCWRWSGSTTSGGYPTMKPMGCDCTLVRRVVLDLVGVKLKPRQPTVTTCGERLCVNPAHLKPSTAAKVGQAAAARGAFSTTTRGAKIAAAKRAANGKLSMDIAREIRASTDTNAALAERHGVHPSLVQRIKAGKSWRDYSNPFAGLMRKAA